MEKLTIASKTRDAEEFLSLAILSMENITLTHLIILDFNKE
jgi:hypothetical protein